MGIKSDTGLGNNADELNSAANFYLNTVVLPFQSHIIKVLRKIFTVNNMDMPVRFEQLKPITTRFTNQDLMAVMTQDEIREELGLAPLKEDVDVNEDFTKMAEYTALDTFIDEFGEDMPDEWELVDEEVVDGEHNDFDFEAELNEIANDNIELASAITAKPNIITKDKKAKDKENTYINQDGVSKDFNNYYKVRYVYTKDGFLNNKSGTSRDFCRKMMAAKKVFRKKDILDTNSNSVNPGFGHDGANYNLFLFKGGPQCFHFWLRRIYKTSLTNAKSKISSSQIISYTKAKSEGFTAKRNDKLVAIPPRRMKNNGYYN